MEPYPELYAGPYPDADSYSKSAPRSASRHVRRWLALGGLALAFALTLGVGMVVGEALLPSVQAASFTPGNTNVLQYPQFPGDRHQPFAGTPGEQSQCGVLTVSSVSGSTIVATATDGSSVTIHTTSTTQYTKGGQSSTASVVTAGAHIHVDGTRNSDGSITATRIDVE